MHHHRADIPQIIRFLQTDPQNHFYAGCVCGRYKRRRYDCGGFEQWRRRLYGPLKFFPCSHYFPPLTYFLSCRCTCLFFSYKNFRNLVCQSVSFVKIARGCIVNLEYVSRMDCAECFLYLPFPKIIAFSTFFNNTAYVHFLPLMHKLPAPSVDISR